MRDYVVETLAADDVVLVIAALEGAVVVGGLGALSPALFSLGIPKDSVIKYEGALKADGFLIIGYGAADEMARARDDTRG